MFLEIAGCLGWVKERVMGGGGLKREFQSGIVFKNGFCDSGLVDKNFDLKNENI